MTRKLAEIEARANAAMKGPWDWWCNVRSKSVYLATVHGGRVFVMTFKRLGMDSAQPCFQVDHRMLPATKLGKPDHNGEIDIRHHDATFIAAAREDVPALCAALRIAVEALDAHDFGHKTGCMCGKLVCVARRRIAEHVEVTP